MSNSFETAGTPQESLSLVHGSKTPPLWYKTLGALLRERVREYGDRTAVVVPWQKSRLTYSDLESRSQAVARALLAVDLQPGERVAIMGGNRSEYIEVFLAAGRIGCPLLVINNTYTPAELITALSRTSPKVLFIALSIGNKSLLGHVAAIQSSIRGMERPLDLPHVALLGGNADHNLSPSFQSYSDFVAHGDHLSSADIQRAESKVNDGDILSLQFTSGTTGLPKAAMLTHRNMINNGRFIGSRMKLTSRDILCCPPPLFHCFGLVMGYLTCLSYGCSIVFPSDAFDPSLTLDAIVAERCTALHGVPTMFLAELDALRSKPYKITSIRTGIAAGSKVPKVLLDRLDIEMGLRGILTAYGMTETSPVTFMMSADDAPERLLKGLGKVMPHTSAKIIDRSGRILPRGSRGELCITGYPLMKGYASNEKATKDTMKVDETGTVWIHTGDECVIDEQGYCEITGRIKDMIIRGGENIFPAEVEERLLQHAAICEASVIGLKDEKYGEVVGCFLRATRAESRPGDEMIQEWVAATLGRHKVPKRVFWIGDRGVGEDFPKTGSGKHQKHILRALGEKLQKLRAQPRARL